LTGCAIAQLLAVPWRPKAVVACEQQDNFLQQAKVCNCPGHDGVVHVGGCPPVRRRYLVTRLQTSTDGCPRSTADTPDHVSDTNTFACHLRDNAADTPLKISQCTHPVGDQVVFPPKIFFCVSRYKFQYQDMRAFHTTGMAFSGGARESTILAGACTFTWNVTSLHGQWLPALRSFLLVKPTTHRCMACLTVSTLL
jgi:hypothetical protein